MPPLRATGEAPAARRSALPRAQLGAPAPAAGRAVAIATVEATTVEAKRSEAESEPPIDFTALKPWREFLLSLAAVGKREIDGMEFIIRVISNRARSMWQNDWESLARGWCVPKVCPASS